jgi:hypothetical protein
MTAILLIAANYVREQRWVLVGLALYPPGMALLLRAFDTDLSASDLLVFIQQQASFAVLFAVVFAAAAIHQDRRSRRILSILSKSIRRSQYIAGLLVGVWSFIAIYDASAIFTLYVVAPSSAAYALKLLVPAYFAAVASSATTILFTTFMPPFFATIVAGIVLGIPAIFDLLHIHAPVYLSPSYFLLLDLTVGREHGIRPDLLLYAVAHSVIFWALSSIVFSYRDIAVAIE